MVVPNARLSASIERIAGNVFVLLLGLQVGVMVCTSAWRNRY
jgi:hypothetical protein